jgi:hypothetical protein
MRFSTSASTKIPSASHAERIQAFESTTPALIRTLSKEVILLNIRI